MTEDKEPILGVLDEPIFPLTDRQAPIADRIRKRRNGSSKTLGVDVGTLVGEMAVMADDEEKAETANEMMEQFRMGIADALGVPEQQVNQELIADFGTMFAALDEDDIVVESETSDDDGGDEEEEEDSSPF